MDPATPLTRYDGNQQVEHTRNAPDQHRSGAFCCARGLAAVAVVALRVGAAAEALPVDAGFELADGFAAAFVFPAVVVGGELLA